MSTVVELAPPHSFGHPIVNAMARPLNGWGHEPYAPSRSAPYYRQEPPREVRDPRDRVQLPGPATLFTAVNHAHQVGNRESQYGVGGSSRASYYTEYATPSPVGQTPPQLPAPGSEGHHQMAASLPPRRPVDVRLSPTQSSISSDRSDDVDTYRHQMKAHRVSQPLPPRLNTTQFPYPPREQHRHSESPSSASLGKLPQVFPTMNGQYSSHSSHHPASPSSIHPITTSPRSEAKQMSITNLLTHDGPRHDSTRSCKAPMPSPARSTVSEYRIRVRQQPVAARSCGFGERDRRVIDPPPIVQLTIDDADATQAELSQRIRHPFSVVHCSIWDETGAHDTSAMPEDYRQQRRLMGTLVASPFVGMDENGEEGCFFCFPDLSCRTPGSFRLKFSLVILDPMGMRPGGSSPIVASVMSEVFTVYNAKDFPGMQASTALTKRLKEQGCLISIKKGNDKAGGGGGATHGRDDSDEDGDEEGGGSSKGRKRQRKS